MSNGRLSTQDELTLNSIFNPNLPFDIENGSTQPETGRDPDEALTEVAREGLRLDRAGVQAAEENDLEGALKCFSEAIELDSTRAASYNNRAQVLRILGDSEGAHRDLAQAIELSKGQGSAAAQAFVQRACLYRFQGDDEASLEDFKKAAALGNKYAKQMVVKLNPFAAMCNNMLAQVIEKVQKGEP